MEDTLEKMNELAKKMLKTLDEMEKRGEKMDKEIKKVLTRIGVV